MFDRLGPSRSERSPQRTDLTYFVEILNSFIFFKSKKTKMHCSRFTIGASQLAVIPLNEYVLETHLSTVVYIILQDSNFTKRILDAGTLRLLISAIPR